MSETDDYIHAIKQFEKLRHEYLEWLAETDHVLNLLRRVDIGNTDWAKVVGDQPRREGRFRIHISAPQLGDFGGTP